MCDMAEATGPKAKKRNADEPAATAENAENITTMSQCTLGMHNSCSYTCLNSPCLSYSYLNSCFFSDSYSDFYCTSQTDRSSLPDPKTCKSCNYF